MDDNGATELDPTIDFIAGTLAGIAGLTVGHPFDTVKVRFQTPGIAQRYTSTCNAITTIVREERVSGLFKGITSPLASCAILNGVVFASYKFFIKAQVGGVEGIPTLAQIGMAGVGSGIVCSLITTPTELIKIRQQQSLGMPESTWGMANRIWRREGGVRGLYRGFGATLFRDTGYGAYFAAYELSRRLLTRSPPPVTYAPPHLDSTTSNPPLSPSWAALLISGGIAGVVGWALTFPFDVVKTRVQGSPLVPTFPLPPTEASPLLGVKAAVEINPYRGTWSTIVHSYKSEGVGVFYRGLAPTLIRAIPVNMVMFAVFEGIVHWAPLYF